jgi:hypothetical protein
MIRWWLLFAPIPYGFTTTEDRVTVHIIVPIVNLAVTVWRLVRSHYVPPSVVGSTAGSDAKEE